jgi:hypothetical protein
MPEFDATLEYRDVQGGPGYKVGSDGTVWTCKNGRYGFKNNWREMPGTWVGSPSSRYLTVHLRVDGEDWFAKKHLLVATAFHGPCPEGMECRHLDGKPANNRADNLAWGTHQQNMDDMVRHGTSTIGQTMIRGSECPNAKLTEEKARWIGDMIMAGYKTGWIAREVLISPQTVAGIKAGRAWRYLFTEAELSQMNSMRDGRRGRWNKCSKSLSP